MSAAKEPQAVTAGGETGRRRAAPAAAAALPEEARAVLRQLFSVQDSLSAAEAVAVAGRVPRCTAEQALAFFQELQDAVQACLQRALQQAADGEAGGGLHGTAAAHGAGASSAVDAVPGLPAGGPAGAAAASRQAASAELAAMLDGSGGLKDASLAGPFVALAAGLSSGVVRSQAAAAVAASRQTVRAKLLASAGFLTTLEDWLAAAVLQQQYSLARDVLLALAVLPLGPALLRGSPALQRRVKALAQHAHGGVAAAATALHARWQQALRSAAGDQAAAVAKPPGQAGAAPPRPGPPPRQGPPSLGEGLPSRQLAAQGTARDPTVPDIVPLVPLSRTGVGSVLGASLARQPVGQGRRAFPAAPAAAAHRPISSDDIRRQQERQRQQAQLAALRQAEAVAGQAQSQEQQQEEEEEQQLQQQQQAASGRQEQQGAASGMRNLRNTPLFQKLRRSMAAAKTSASAPAGSSLSGATLKPSTDAQGSPAAAGQQLNGGTASAAAPSRQLHRLESVQSATLGPAEGPPPPGPQQAEPAQQPPAAAAEGPLVEVKQEPPLQPKPEPHPETTAAAAAAAVPQANDGRAAGEGSVVTGGGGVEGERTPGGRAGQERRAGSASAGRMDRRQAAQQQQQQGQPWEEQRRKEGQGRADAGMRRAAEGTARREERRDGAGQPGGTSIKRARGGEGAGAGPAAASPPGGPLPRKARWGRAAKRARKEAAQGDATGSDRAERRGAGLPAALSGMQEQTIWQAPQPCEVRLPATTIPPSTGEESTETRARREARQRGPSPAPLSADGEPLAAPVEDQGRAATCRPQLMPYFPVKRDERLDQEELLRAGGWRPQLRAAMR